MNIETGCLATEFHVANLVNRIAQRRDPLISAARRAEIVSDAIVACNNGRVRNLTIAVAASWGLAHGSRNESRAALDIIDPRIIRSN